MPSGVLLCFLDAIRTSSECASDWYIFAFFVHLCLHQRLAADEHFGTVRFVVRFSALWVFLDHTLTRFWVSGRSCGFYGHTGLGEAGDVEKCFRGRLLTWFVYYRKHGA